MWRFVEVEERGRDLSVADLVRHCAELGQDTKDVFLDLGVASSGGIGGDVVFELKYEDGVPYPEEYVVVRRPRRSEIHWTAGMTEDEIEEELDDPLKGWD